MGNTDRKNSVGIVSVNYATRVVTGTGTSFGQVGSASTGDVIRIGSRTGIFHGDAVVVSIASTTQLSIASTTGLSGIATQAATFSISQAPKYTTLDSHYTKRSGANTQYDALVYGADVAEVGAATTYAMTHAGWVGITTYMCDGVMRVKTETLVAMSSIQGDANDDSVLGDS